MSSAAGRKLFRKENLHIMPEDLIYVFFTGDIRYMDPQRDRLLLGSLARYAQGTQRRAALRRLGLDAAPEESFARPSDEKYRILEEQVRRLTDLASYSLLKEAAFDSRCAASAFAFCRLTGSSVIPPGGSYRRYDFSCGLLPCMTERDVLDFCREMAEKRGPFAPEAEAILLGRETEKGD